MKELLYPFISIEVDYLLYLKLSKQNIQMKTDFDNQSGLPSVGINFAYFYIINKYSFNFICII